MKKSLAGLPRKQAAFLEPMQCKPVAALPEGKPWLFEVKLDGFRVLAIKQGGEVSLISRHGNSLTRKFFYVADALQALPEGTVLDGELLALDRNGRSSFSLIQSYRSQAANIHYYAFDIVCLKNRDLTQLPLTERRAWLAQVLPTVEHVRLSECVETSSTDMLRQIRERNLEGVVAKLKNSVYEPGERSGAWVKHRINRGQEFVIGGYMPGPHGVDALLVGFYRGGDLVYVAPVRNGFVPQLRREVFEQVAPLATPKCPFANLPQTGRSRWGGEGLTAEKMKRCVWLRPEAVAQIEFLEWTASDHLRHARFAGMRHDKQAKDVVKEVPE
jgi:bifunctional non-homologous end joining protein LigD